MSSLALNDYLSIDRSKSHTSSREWVLTEASNNGCLLLLPYRSRLVEPRDTCDHQLPTCSFHVIVCNLKNQTIYSPNVVSTIQSTYAVCMACRLNNSDLFHALIASKMYH